MDRPIIDISRYPAPTPERVYRVPTRFGIGSVFLFTAMFCGLFGILRYYHAHPATYLLSIAYFFAVGGAQMVWGEFPRGVSIGAGAVLLPVAVLIINLTDERGVSSDTMVCLVPASIGVGAFFGYLAGALLAGFFLVAELIDRQLGLHAHRDEVIDAELSDADAPGKRPSAAEYVDKRIPPKDGGVPGPERAD